MKVLFAEAVEFSHVSALEHTPKRLHPVCVRHSPHILSSTVIDCFMKIRKSRIRTAIVCIYDSIRVSMSLNKTLKCSFLSVVDGLWYNFVGASIFWSNEGGLTNCTPAKFSSSLCWCLGIFFRLPPMYVWSVHIWPSNNETSLSKDLLNR